MSKKPKLGPRYASQLIFHSFPHCRTSRLRLETCAGPNACRAESSRFRQSRYICLLRGLSAIANLNWRNLSGLKQGSGARNVPAHSDGCDAWHFAKTAHFTGFFAATVDNAFNNATEPKSVSCRLQCDSGKRFCINNSLCFLLAQQSPDKCVKIRQQHECLPSGGWGDQQRAKPFARRVCRRAPWRGCAQRSP